MRAARPPRQGWSCPSSACVEQLGHGTAAAQGHKNTGFCSPAANPAPWPPWDIPNAGAEPDSATQRKRGTNFIQITPRTVVLPRKHPLVDGTQTLNSLPAPGGPWPRLSRAGHGGLEDSCSKPGFQRFISLSQPLRVQLGTGLTGLGRVQNLQDTFERNFWKTHQDQKGWEEICVQQSLGSGGHLLSQDGGVWFDP